MMKPWNRSKTYIPSRIGEKQCQSKGAQGYPLGHRSPSLVKVEGLCHCRFTLKKFFRKHMARNEKCRSGIAPITYENFRNEPLWTSVYVRLPNLSLDNVWEWDCRPKRSCKWVAHPIVKKRERKYEYIIMNRVGLCGIHFGIHNWMYTNELLWPQPNL